VEELLAASIEETKGTPEDHYAEITRTVKKASREFDLDLRKDKSNLDSLIVDCVI